MERMTLSYPYQFIDPEKYIEILSDPLWYLHLQDHLKEYFYSYNGEKEQKTNEWLNERAEFIELVMELHEQKLVAVGKFGVNYDRERAPIDTAIIHHSSSLPDESLLRLEALSLIRIYAPVHANPEEACFQNPIWSNHFFEDRQTFMPYHYLIFPDGRQVQTLKDEYIGWHCGNWNYNKKSIGICFVDNLLERKPTEAALETAREIIKKYQPKHVLGHREVKDNRTCPGNLFLGEDGWKKKLIS